MENIEKLAKEGSELMAKGQYSEALKLFEEVLESKDDHLYSVYGKAYCLAFKRNSTSDANEKKELTEKIWQLCEKLIEITPEHGLFPYLNEHLFPRETLRFAYNAFAWYTYENAEGEEQLEEANEYIDHCLSLKSPLDKEESFFGYYDTKVRILLKLNQKDAAYLIVKRVLEKDPEFGDFQDIRASKEYKEWVGQGKLDEYLKGKEGETAYEAIMRLDGYLKKFGHSYHEEISFSDPISMKEIHKVEAKLSIKLPPSYKEFISNHGLFSVDEGAYYQMLAPKEALKDTLELRKESHKAYKGEEDLKDELDAINNSFFFQNNPYPGNYFAFYLKDVNENGEMTIQRFYHDDAYIIHDDIKGFNEHISQLINRIIEEDNE